ncbi:hypothetical protein SRHO_G00322360 [Serrasalmus rhombeus]
MDESPDSALTRTGTRLKHTRCFLNRDSHTCWRWFSVLSQAHTREQSQCLARVGFLTVLHFFVMFARAHARISVSPSDRRTVTAALLFELSLGTALWQTLTYPDLELNTLKLCSTEPA